jgi:formylglycine-generating enzyme required for sulfatase activity/tRNA A-37 threonylcarbamoyl transferase component Bud32
MFHPNDMIGEYTLVEFLGEGQFGEVWLAEKRTRILTTRVALKLPKSRVTFEDVEKEARVWEQAKGHPNVLPIVDADIHNDQVYIASEYSPDGSLEDWLKQHGGKAPSIYAAVDMMRGILAGLEHLHKRQIIHRDLKPANILLQGDIPRITDFGIAKFLPSGTESNVIKGSPAYMSPEALNGERNEQTDLWSAAVICYQLLCGGLPFTGSLFELFKAIGLNEPAPLPETVPQPLRDFVMTALRKHPGQRCPTASVLRQSLQTAYQQTVQLDQAATLVIAPPISEAPETTMIRGDERERRRRREGFVLLPAGEFLMGSATYDDEKPIHRVRLSQAFEISKYPVTQAQWQAVMGNNPSYFRGADLPVEQVSWNDVQGFLQKVNASYDGYLYRLPTEAEWEYACRAGSTGDYAGDLDEMGWYDQNSGNQTHIVGQKKANAWGLCDMHGNVWEWCQDWYDGEYYARSPESDPQGPESGSGRVTRGGSWGNPAACCRQSFRDFFSPDDRFGSNGFRLVRTPR